MPNFLRFKNRTERAFHNVETFMPDYENAMKLSSAWRSFAEQYLDQGHCTSILAGMRGVAIDAGACASMGLIRPALYSLRAFYDLAFSWIYLNDHEDDWRNCIGSPETEGDNFPLNDKLRKIYGLHRRRELARPIYRHMSKKLRLLTKHKTRKMMYPYRYLSEAIHPMRPEFTPVIKCIEDSVDGERRQKEFLDIAFSVSEYISDIYACRYYKTWQHMPDTITAGIASRLDAEALEKFRREPVETEVDTA